MIRALSTKPQQICPLCDHHHTCNVAQSSAANLYRCQGCGVDFADYHRQTESTATADHFSQLDAEQYNRSVRATRINSYHRLTSTVSKHVPQGRWLDVGCSYGWLLEHVDKQGYEPMGIEPSAPAAQAAKNLGYEVRSGCFPEALDEPDRFDVISLIDVLEHLIDPVTALQQLKHHVLPHGVVVLQVPDKACLLYRAAEGMCRASRGRLDFALQRLWLTELDFPHRFYFTRRSLFTLLDRCGYQLLEYYRSPISSPRQAFDRVGYYRQGRASSSLAVACAVGAINAVDAATGFGGLLTVVAQPRRSQT